MELRYRHEICMDMFMGWQSLRCGFLFFSFLSFDACSIIIDSIPPSFPLQNHNYQTRAVLWCTAIIVSLLFTLSTLQEWFMSSLPCLLLYLILLCTQRLAQMIKARWMVLVWWQMRIVSYFIQLSSQLRCLFHQMKNYYCSDILVVALEKKL